ncbi:MAG: DUF1573 domain-containing protein [Bacteroidales bacterium]
MKRLFVVAFFLSTALLVAAQPVMKLETREHDFGTFREEAGKQTFVFNVTNTGDKPLVIQNIVASCGCTAPDWTRTPVAPGGKGKITAVFDPLNRGGSFRKTLTVYSNSNPSPVVLTIKGEVVSRIKSEAENYSWHVGSLMLQGNSIAFPQVLNTEKRIKVLPVYNNSTAPLKVEFENVPPYIELSTIPSVLKPGTKGLVECIYHGNKVSKWGNVTDIVSLKINGKSEPGELFILAGLMEDFSSLSKADLENAPVLSPEALRFDLGAIEPGSSREIEFKFRNTGKKDLIIRSVWSSCQCISKKEGSDNKIAPGTEGKIMVTFSTEKMLGKISRSFYVYTNDPKNSKVAVSVMASVNPVVK